MRVELRRLAQRSRQTLELAARRLTRRLSDIIRPPLFEYPNETLNDRWIVERVFPGKRNGYFIEAGAAGGIAASCTYILEKEFGWTGICVEPNTWFFSQLEANRPNSRCENVCLARQSGKVRYIEGNEATVSPYLGGIKENLENIKHEGQKVVERGREVEKEAMTLEAMLDKHQAPPIIDYAAFDMEGSEFDVLEGFPFDKYTFLAITLECDWKIWHDVTNLLTANGYQEVRNPYNVDKPWERYWLFKGRVPK
ncbi:FkbM family methyltransferase [Methylomagnum sp.]